MGVRGLSSFFNQNAHLSTCYKLHDTPVIIDGNNLIHALYFSYKVDCVYGGDYSKYASSIKKYLLSYIECNIKPIVIFDGGYDKSDRKLKTLFQRFRARLTLTEHIAKYGQCSGKVLPIIAYEVFRDVLIEMNIQFAQCDFEADDQVTALANHYQCPVVSDDSDFYIFDIHKGFIRLDSIDPAIFVDKDADGNQYSFLKCEMFHIDKFLSYFPGIDKNVLPLFGTLIGNDYVPMKVFEKFFSNIQLPKYKCSGLKANPRQRKIIGLLSWLRHTDLSEAMRIVLLHLKKDKREQVKSIIEAAVDGYKLQNCNLIYILENRCEDLKRELKLVTKLSTPCGQALPATFVLHFHQGIFPSFFLNIITLHRTFLPSQVENVALDSSFLCSSYIRKVLYGILLRHDNLNIECKNEKCLRPIDEYDRRNGTLHREVIKPIFCVTDVGILPKLNELDAISQKHSELLITKVLGCETTFFSAIPKNYKLLFGCVNYWLRNCDPKPAQPCVDAFIINVLYFTLLNNVKLNHDEDPNTDSRKGDASKILALLKSVNESDIQIAANLKKYLKKPTFNNGNPLILHIVHSFSQLQTCILYAMYLNKLIGFPFKSPEIHKSFNGTLLYNLTKDILSRPYPQLFIAELLGRESILNNLFNEIKIKILENIPDDCFMKLECTQVHRRKKKNRNCNKPAKIPIKTKDYQERDSGITELCNKFNFLNEVGDESCNI